MDYVGDATGCWVRSGGGDVRWGLSARLWSSLFPAVSQRTGSGKLPRRSGRALRHYGRGTPLPPARRHARHLPRAMRLRLHCRQSLGTPPLPRSCIRSRNARCRHRRRYREETLFCCVSFDVVKEMSHSRHAFDITDCTYLSTFLHITSSYRQNIHIWWYKKWILLDCSVYSHFKTPRLIWFWHTTEAFYYE